MRTLASIIQKNAAEFPKQEQQRPTEISVTDILTGIFWNFHIYCVSEENKFVWSRFFELYLFILATFSTFCIFTSDPPRHQGNS